MRNERDLDVGAGGARQFLLDLRRVAVPAKSVGSNALRDFGKQQVLPQCPSGPRNPRLGVNHDGLEFDQLGRQEGKQGQERGRRVAARTGHQRGGANRRTGVFGQSVNGVALQFRRQMGSAVPLGVAREIAEPEVRRSINHANRRNEARSGFLSRAVGEAAKHQRTPGAIELVHVYEWRQVQATQPGK